MSDSDALLEETIREISALFANVYLRLPVADIICLLCEFKMIRFALALPTIVYGSPGQ
jgi:hypothetical protein